MIDSIGDKCTGCYACVNICPKQCIDMHINREGFWYPRVRFVQCIGCNRCEQVCPVLTPIQNNKRSEDISVFALVHKDSAIRSQSSSGGAFSAIAEEVLLQQGVVFGAAFDNHWNVRHIAVETIEDLPKLRGSKYVQSNIDNTFQQAKRFLEEGRIVLFSGTACQTTGLIGFLGHDYDNLITLDLICHGVPSPMVWERYIKFRERLARSTVEHIFFRDKSDGWHRWHLKINFKNGSVYSQSQYDDIMIRAFLSGQCSRECCYHCRFKQKYRLADFTLADYWGIEHIAPELDDDGGISACFVNSEKARKLFAQIQDKVYAWKLDVETAVSYNPAMVESEQIRGNREGFLLDVQRKPFDIVVGKYLDQARPLAKIKWTIRRLMGEQKYEKMRARLKRVK